MFSRPDPERSGERRDLRLSLLLLSFRSRTYTGCPPDNAVDVPMSCQRNKNQHAPFVAQVRQQIAYGTLAFCGVPMAATIFARLAFLYILPGLCRVIRWGEYAE